MAEAASVRAAKGLKSKRKFEEDISSPFVSRYSHSNTVKSNDKLPGTLKAAKKLFPAIGELRHDGQAYSDRRRLQPTHSVSVFERVLTGPTMQFGKVPVEVALILWSNGPTGRPLVAEFSYRYGNEKEEYTADVAQLAMAMFMAFQRLDWCVPDGRTKTQYAYGENS